MNVRVVAFRKDTTASADVTQFELDLAEAPNIVVNYNWIDIKEPDKRKGSFSQTLKLPFSDRNNTFFENWFNVNLDSLVFDTNTKFNATVFIDTIEQMQGFIQLKAIYLNARQYEVAIFGNTANFFTDIKDKKLRQAFETDGVADEQLDHLLNNTNVYNSWNAGLTTINPVTTTNDVMYPIIDYGHTSHPLAEGMFTDTSSGTVSDMNGDELRALGLIQANNLKPAIRIQRLFQIIAQKAGLEDGVGGYTITSTFMGIAQDGTLSDTSFFSRLFMTLSNQYDKVKTYYDGFGFQVSMAAAVEDVKIYGDEDNWTNSVVKELGFTNESDPNFDPYNIFYYNPQTINGNTVQLNSIIIPVENQASQIGLPEGYQYQAVGLDIDFSIDLPQEYIDDVSGSEILYEVEIRFEYKVMAAGIPNETGWNDINALTTTIITNPTFVTNPSADYADGGLQNIPLSSTSTLPNIEPGDDIHFRLRFIGYAGLYNNITTNDYFEVNVNSGTIKTFNTGVAGYTNGTYGKQVVMAENMPDINQVDFVKDLVNRFNLIVLNDPANENNLIIEPYQDYIADGSSQYWTDKLDVSKEQVIKSTNHLQKKEFIFSDKEGAEDHMGERYERERKKVYGTKIEYGGDFSEGDGKNFSIYSPFITTGIMRQGWSPFNFWGVSPLPVAVCQWYKLINSATFEREVITDSIPRLFYYSGTPISFSGFNYMTGSSYVFKIYSPGIDAAVSTGNTFPLCTAYNLDNLDTGIAATTKQLLWDWITPNFNFPWFVNNPFGSGITPHGYFYDYWSKYFNEIYSKEARIMECYLNLTPADIAEFEANAFKNPIYIKNTLWRILKIDGYLVGGNKSTKVTLLKVLEKLNYDCTSVPSTFNNDGTITFVNPASGDTTTVTNECCEDLNDDWTFNQTNDSTGVGNCYHNLDISVVNPGGYDGTDFEGLQDIQAPVQLPMVANTNTVTETRNKQIIGQVSSAVLQTLTIGTAVSYLNYKNSPSTIQLKPYTMAYLEVDIIGTIVKGSNLGAVGYFKYYTLLSRTLTTISHSGASGGIQLRKIEGTNFPSTPTINITNINSTTGDLDMSITSSSADYTITWLAKLEVIAQKLVGADGSDVYQDFAIYQNADMILMQNASFLVWN